MRNHVNLKQCFYRPGMIIGAGGFGADAVWTVSAEMQLAFGGIPPSLRRCVIEFPSDPPRPPVTDLPIVPPEIWNRVSLQTKEVAFIGYPQGLARSLVQEISRDNRYAWLEQVMPFADVEKCVGRRESGSIPALTRFFLALQLFAGTWDGDPAWLTKIETVLTQLSPQFFESAMLAAGVDARNIRSTPAIVAIVGGGSGGTNNGALVPLCIAVRDIARRIGLAVEVHVHAAMGLYRPPDDLHEKKQALSFTLSADCHDAKNGGARTWSFPMGPDKSLAHHGPLIDRAFRYEANEKMEHNYGAMLIDVSSTLFNYFFNRAFFETERNWTNA